MSSHKELERRISAKAKQLEVLESQFESLKSQIIELRYHLEGLREAHTIIVRELASSGIKTVEFKSGSDAERVYTFLRGHGKPAHIREIANALGKTAAADRVAIASKLSWYFRKGKVFTRPEPNVFGLLEFGNNGQLTLNNQTGGT